MPAAPAAAVADVPGRQLPKKPSWWTLRGDLPAIRQDILGFLSSKMDSDDPVWVRFGPRRALLLTRHAQVRDLFANDANLRKGMMFDVLRRVIGRGLVGARGADAVAQRELLASHLDNVNSDFAPLMFDEAKALIERWAVDPVADRDYESEFERFTINVATKALFGKVDEKSSGLTDDQISRIQTAMDRMRAAMAAIVMSLEIALPGWMPTPNSLRLQRARRELDSVVAEILEQRAGGPHEHDLLSCLVAAYGNSRLLRDELITVLLAGHGTTAAALTWALCELAYERDVQQAFVSAIDAAADADDELIAQEFAATLDDVDPAYREALRRHLEAFSKAAPVPSGPGALSLKQITRALKFDNSVFTESLRKYPPVYVLDRVTTDLIENAGGYRIPKGTAILMSPWAMHRHAQFFDDAHAFKPSRWEKGATGKRSPTVSFGQGSRNCVGGGFAIFEATIVLSLIVERFDIHPIGPRPEPEATITLRPRGGLRLRLTERPKAKPN